MTVRELIERLQQEPEELLDKDVYIAYEGKYAGFNLTWWTWRAGERILLLEEE